MKGRKIARRFDSAVVAVLVALGASACIDHVIVSSAQNADAAIGPDATKDAVPKPAMGVYAAYYDNPEFEGAPVLERYEPDVNQTFSEGLPLGVNPGFSARWRGQINVPQAGTYVMFLVYDDGARLLIDNVTLIEDWQRGGPSEKAVEVLLSAGLHRIEVQLTSRGEEALIGLGWSTASMPKQLIPPAAFFPPP